MDNRYVAVIDAGIGTKEEIYKRIEECDREGADELYIYNFAPSDADRDAFVHLLRDIGKYSDLPYTAGGYADRLEDVKKIYYAGAKRVLLDKAYLSDEKIIEDAITKFGKDRIIACEKNEGAGFFDGTKKFKGKSELKPAFAFSELKKNSDGLVPVIVTDYKNGEVLMLAYMNEEAYNLTVSTGRMTYYSRSRKKLWVKGEESGHFQYVRELRIDCDEDTILAKVKQIGAACHTGNRSCFYRPIIKKDFDTNNIGDVLTKVFGVIADRKVNPKEGSYTNYLFDKGIDKILKKCGEEATEIVIAAKNPDAGELKYEMADFLYHMMVLMADQGLTWDDLATELSNRE